MDVPHEEQVGDQREQHVDSLQHDAVHKEPRVLHIAGHAIENGAGPVHLEESEAQLLQPRVDPAAQIRHDLSLGQPGRHHVVMVGENGPQQGLRDNRQG